MIENDRQLEITKKWKADFEAGMQKTIDNMSEETENDKIKKQLYIDTQRSTIEIFAEDIKEYESI